MPFLVLFFAKAVESEVKINSFLHLSMSEAVSQVLIQTKIPLMPERKLLMIWVWSKVSAGSLVSSNI